jgi:tRNA(Leu) C34 or U34 (ribose-2'-O)-methylase TrmL
MLSPVVVLYRPAISGNVGAVVRTCRGWRVPVHIVGPSLLALDGTDVQRAAVGYVDPGDELARERAFTLFADLSDWHARCGSVFPRERRFLLTKRGDLPLQHLTNGLGGGADGGQGAAPLALLFGNESFGVEESRPGRKELLEAEGWRGVRIPMPSGDLRCHNLAISVGMALWEVCRTWPPDAQLA